MMSGGAIDLARESVGRPVSLWSLEASLVQVSEIRRVRLQGSTSGVTPASTKRLFAAFLFVMCDTAAPRTGVGCRPAATCCFL
jgi:hypothetical protein